MGLRFHLRTFALFILDTGIQVLWQTVKTQMKYRIVHFIWICTVCFDESNLLDFIEFDRYPYNLGLDRSSMR